MAISSAGEALPSVYTTRPGEAVPPWLCAELAQLDRASVYETEGRRFDSCIPRHSLLLEAACAYALIHEVTCRAL